QQYIGGSPAARGRQYRRPPRAGKIGVMSERPSRLWRDMPLEKRVAAAAAFWRDRESPEIEAQHAEAIGLLAQRMKFRTRTVAALPVDRRARYLGQIADVSETIATRALIAYHFETQRPLMATFLDAL